MDKKIIRVRRKIMAHKTLIKNKRRLIKIYEKRGDKFSLDLAKGHRRDIKNLVIKVRKRKQK